MQKAKRGTRTIQSSRRITADSGGHPLVLPHFIEDTVPMLTPAEIHLATNHFPIAFAILATVLLILESVLKKQSIGTLGRSLWVVAAALGILVFLSGDGAEDVLESLQLKEGNWIHEHEELAEKAFALLEATGALSLLALVFERSQRLKTWMRPVRLLIFLLGLLTTGFILKAAQLGGQIRHTEIRAVTPTE